MPRPILSLLLATLAAAEPRVAVIDVRAAEASGPEILAAVREALATRLRASGHEPMSAQTVVSGLQTRPELLGCTTAECLEGTAKVLRASRLVGASIRRAGSTVAVDVWIYDPAARASVTGSGSCTGCGVREIGKAAAAALDEALASDARRFVPATVRVNSQPTGATVRLDGRAAGLTPLRLRVPSGSHGLVVSRSGFASESRDFDVQGGETLDLHFALQPTGEPRRWPGYKWLALGGSLVAVGLGGVMLAIDGNEIGGSQGPVEGREVRDTRGGGIVLLSAGVALGVTGATLWWFE